MSYARIPNATIMEPQPRRLHIVIVSLAPPNARSERKTRTMVRRLPMEVRMGPHRPSRIYGMMT